MNKLFRSIVLLCALLSSFTAAYCIPKLNSWPTASATIYLDFDGHDVNSGVWNTGIPFTCAPSAMTDAAITEAFYRVAEDYRPFNINITTDEAVYLSAPMTKRIRVVITPTNSWYPGVGGVTFVGSFTWGDETPCFVFCNQLGPNNAKLVGECCSHESGHSLGLQHQSSYDASCNITEVYNDGQGSGEIGWAPIMGNSYNRNMSSWNNGPTQLGCNSRQDNLSIITSLNGFTYRTDDYLDDINSTQSLIDPMNISVDGLLSTVTDKDAFKFKLSSRTNLHLDATPFNVGINNNGADVDLRVQLYDASKKLVGVFNPSTTLNVVIDTVLNAGDYYLLVDGADNANATEYNSLGSYSLRGFSSVLLPIHSIELTGKTDNSKHDLNWKIIADEPIKSLVIESSNDGINFKAIQNLSAVEKNFSYNPLASSNIYYRLKVISINGETAFSNVVSLKNMGASAKSFIISTLVYNDISVQASAKYQYQLSDMSGKIISRGNGIEGFNKISVAGLARGMYLLQLVNDKTRQIERIIKQ